MCEGVIRVFPSSDEEGWPRHQKNIATASLDGADGVVLTRRNHFLANTTPSALARSHPASAEAGKARSGTLLVFLIGRIIGPQIEPAISSTSPKLTRIESEL